MGPSFEVGEICHQEFSAPDVAVSSISGAIEGNSDDFSAEVVLSHATCDMSVMMLNTDLSFDFRLKGETGAHVVRVQIVRDRAWLDAEELLQIRECLVKELQRLVIFQVTDVLAENCVTVLGQAEGVLQFSTAGHQLLKRNTQVDWVRHISTRAAQNAFAALEGAND